MVCCSLELLIYSVGDLTISILSSKCGGRKAPFGFHIIPSIILHQFSYACTAFEGEPPRFPSENTYFCVFLLVCLFVSPCPVKLWFLLAMLPSASDTLQRDIQECDGVTACSLPGVQPLPQHHSVPRDQDPVGCRVGTPVHETYHTGDTWVAFPQSWLLLQSSMRFAEHPQSSLHLVQCCWLQCLCSIVQRAPQRDWAGSGVTLSTLSSFPCRP